MKFNISEEPSITQNLQIKCKGNRVFIQEIIHYFELAGKFYYELPDWLLNKLIEELREIERGIAPNRIIRRNKIQYWHYFKQDYERYIMQYCKHLVPFTESCELCGK